MEYWRKIVVLIIVVTMPISSWASITIVSHCQTTDTSSHALHTSMNDEQHVHMDHQAASDENIKNVDCECGCNSMLDCSVSGCNVTAMLGDSELKPRTLTQVVRPSVETVIPTPDPHTLFRPPISPS